MKRVLVTRAAEDAPALARLLAEQGLRPVSVPLVSRAWAIDAVAALGRELPHADWVVATSPVVAELVAIAAPRSWPAARWAAVGPKTAKRATELGFRVTVTTSGTGRDLVAAIGDVAGKVIVLPRGDLADPTLEEALVARQACVRSVTAYENLLPLDASARLAAELPVDATTLMSGSAATRLAELVADRAQLGRIAVIGPSTATAARAAGLDVTGVAPTHTAEAIARLVAEWLR
jgi:uroporphyrinogen-III synthase